MACAIMPTGNLKSSWDLHLIIDGLFPTLHRLLPLCTACTSRIELGHGMLNVKECLVPLNSC